MIKNFLVLLLCWGLCGCASYQYGEIYNNALKAGTSITITKQENYQELKERVARYFEARGYKKVIFEDRRKGFIVFSQEGDYGLSCQIVVKYTQKAGSAKIRVDLVNGSDDLVTDDEIAEDIRAIAEQIKNY